MFTMASLLKFVELKIFRVIKALVIQKARELGIDSKLKCCDEFLKQTMKVVETKKSKSTGRKLPKSAIILVSAGSHEIEIAAITHHLWGNSKS